MDEYEDDYFVFRVYYNAIRNGMRRCECQCPTARTKDEARRFVEDELSRPDLGYSDVEILSIKRGKVL